MEATTSLPDEPEFQSKRHLFGPGPSNVSWQVLKALSRPTLGHLDPEFIALMDEVKEGLRYAFRTSNEMTFALSAPGSAAMEACLVNLLEPGEKVIVCRNGVFGGRMAEIAERAGFEVITVDQRWGQPVDPAEVRMALAIHPDAKAVAFVHAETSTGALSDAGAIAGIARKFGALTIVDAVTSLAGVPVLTDQWGLDAVYSGTQKCLSCPPGLAPITLSPRALEVVRNRKTLVQSWFLDFTFLVKYWEGKQRAYHHTAPVNAIYGLHEALKLIRREGLEQSWQRHHRHHLALVAGLEAMGLELVVDPAHRLPQLNVVRIPDGIDDAAVRRTLLERFGVEIGAGLGEFAGKVWRIGLMGYGSNATSVETIIESLGTVLAEQGLAIDVRAAVTASLDTYLGRLMAATA